METKNIVEHTWTTEAGLRAFVVIIRGSYRCGYVCVPETSPLYKKSYNDLSDIDVHGGLTYSDRFDDTSNEWAFGFDCAHSFDGFIPGSFMDQSLTFMTHDPCPPRSLEYCIDQCEKLAKQLGEVQ